MFSFPTHLLVGAALAYLFGFSMLFGAIGGMVPDIDYFTPWHRGPFHSLIIAPISIAVLYLLTRSRLKSLGFGTGFLFHSLADWLNFEGVTLAWPFSDVVFAMNIATWDDLAANALLCAASILIIILVKHRRQRLGWTETVLGLPVIKQLRGLFRK